MAIQLPVALTGQGVPLNTLEGRYYRDTLTYDFYDKIDGMWVKRETPKFVVTPV